MTEPEGRIILSATDLELIAGAEAWPGPALLAIESTGSFVAMTRLTSPSGLVSNTNCVRQGSVHNIEGVDSKNLTFVRFINQGDQLITAITGRLFDRSGRQLGGPVELIAALGPKEAVFLDRDTLGEKFGQTWEGEASLVVTSDIDEDLRLLNLNLVNDETFFNFSCYEGAAMQESDAGADYDPAQVIASSQAVSDTVVFDNNRDREIPTLIYLPEDASPKQIVLFSHGNGLNRFISSYLGEHLAFTDVTALSVLEMLFTRNPAYHPEMAALSTAFWDSWLLGDSAARAWLEGDSGLTVLQSQDTWQFK